tara:strand:- start:299 stop:451 length:153 start_codon:yes stop_codon:yes gene_type:complete
MKKETKLETIFLLLGILVIGLIIHTTYKCYRKNKKLETQKNQITNNIITV